jgi:peptidyl-prolyl cis-trans isomerase SurA
MENFRMYKALLPLLLFSLMWVNTYSQEDVSKIKNLPILTVGKDQITYEQLDKAYQKNVTKQKQHLYMLDKDSLMDFINLYADYKLKVLDALSKGLDKDSSIKAESAQNRKVLAESFLFEKVLTEPNVNLMLDRRKFENKIAIIFTTFTQGPTKDTVAAFKKINEAMAKIKSGEDFANVAKDYCDDKNIAEKGGVVDQWITSGKIYRELEDAIYSIKPGEVYTKIISTPYGYFIVKLLDKQPRYLVMGGQILFKNEKNSADSVSSASKTANNQEKAIVVLKDIRQGKITFEEAAKKYSDDKYSAQNGGSFDDWYSRSTGFEKNKGLLNPSFADALFALKDGEVSDIINTDFGEHIVKRFAHKDIDLEKEKDDVRKIYKSQYFDSDKMAYLDSLAKVMDFKIISDNYNKFMKSLDTNRSNITKSWADSLPQSLLDKELFEISNKKYSVGNFVQEMTTNPQLRGYSTNPEGIKRAIDKIIEPTEVDYATKNLEQEYPDFKELLSEFNDGILLFKVETMEVWDKLSFDSTKAKAYYDSTKSRYFTDPMYDITEIYVLSDSVANHIYARAIKGENFDTLAHEYTQRSGYREKCGKWGLVSAFNNKVAKLVYDKNIKEPMILKPEAIDNGFSIIKVNKYVAPRQKTFEEAIPDFASKMQDQIQKQLLNNWLESLRKRFPVKINKKNVDEILKFNKKELDGK